MIEYKFANLSRTRCKQQNIFRKKVYQKRGLFDASSLNEKEYKSYNHFLEKHNKCKNKKKYCKLNLSTTGEYYKITLIPSSIGTTISLTCLLCDSKKNITDYDSW